MLAVERLQYIHEKLNVDGFISVTLLSEELKVSDETIRRDLEKLGRQDPNIVRTHGGAYKITAFDKEAPYRLREQLSTDLKQRIAEIAYPLLKMNDTVMFDSSTTALFLARYVKQTGLALSVITNSIRIIEELRDCDNIKLILIGGSFRKNAQSLTGYSATEMLKDLRADKCFISCTGLDIQQGMTDNDEGESRIRALMLNNSKEKYLLADEHKFGKSFMFGIADLSVLTAVITEHSLSDEWKICLTDHQVPVITK